MGFFSFTDQILWPEAISLSPSPRGCFWTNKKNVRQWIRRCIFFYTKHLVASLNCKSQDFWLILLLFKNVLPNSVSVNVCSSSILAYARKLNRFLFIWCKKLQNVFPWFVNLIFPRKQKRIDRRNIGGNLPPWAVLLPPQRGQQRRWVKKQQPKILNQNKIFNSYGLKEQSEVHATCCGLTINLRWITRKIEFYSRACHNVCAFRCKNRCVNRFFCKKNTYCSRLFIILFNFKNSVQLPWIGGQNHDSILQAVKQQQPSHKSNSKMLLLFEIWMIY